jgi:hypothetical protein
MIWPVRLVMWVTSMTLVRGDRGLELLDQILLGGRRNRSLASPRSRPARALPPVVSMRP